MYFRAEVDCPPLYQSLALGNKLSSSSELNYKSLCSSCLLQTISCSSTSEGSSITCAQCGCIITSSTSVTSTCPSEDNSQVQVELPVESASEIEEKVCIYIIMFALN